MTCPSATVEQRQAPPGRGRPWFAGTVARTSNQVDAAGARHGNGAGIENATAPDPWYSRELLRRWV